MPTAELSKPNSDPRRVLAFVPGIYPRSEALVQATRDLDRGRTTPQALAEQVEHDRREFVSTQEAAGIDLLADGMLDWQDVFRPLAERSEGVEARPLVRFLDTNTFFRGWIVSGRPRLREPIPAPALPAEGWLCTLPSPYALARAADGAVEARAAAADVIAPQIEAWLADGAQLIVLQEPFLARHPEAMPELAAALEELPGKLQVVLQLVFGDAGPLLERIAELPIAGVGIDFYATSLDQVPKSLPLWILAGVVDARSSVLEEPAVLAAFTSQLLERAPQGVALGPNGDLQFVPEPIARKKIAALGSARDAVASDERPAA